MNINKFALLACVSVFVLIAPMGCGTLKTTDPTTGEVTVNQQKLEQTAALIQTTVANGATLAIAQSPDDADAIRSYLNVAKSTIDGLIGGETWTGQDLTDAITAIEGVDSPEIKLAVNTALGAYRVFLAESVSGPIQEDQIALTLLTAFRDGLALGAQ